MTTTSTRVRMHPEERDELHALARAQGIPLSEALRKGARLYLSALASGIRVETPGAPEYRIGRPRKARQAA